MNFKVNNSAENTFMCNRSMNVDGKQRLIVVVGVRGETEKNDVKIKTVEHGRVTEMYNKITRQKIRTFDVVYTILNPEDDFDSTICNKNIQRRFKKKEFHLHLETPNFFGSTLCQTIIENEADYIVNHIENFIPKE